MTEVCTAAAGAPWYTGSLSGALIVTATARKLTLCPRAGLPPPARAHRDEPMIGRHILR